MTQDEIVTEAMRDAIFETIWPLADWDGERAVAFNAAGAAARAAITAMRAAGQERGDDDAEWFKANAGQLRMLLSMVENDIKREGETASFMIRVGLLRDILVNAERIADRLQAKAPETGEG